jgi:hypothetical protein
VDTSGRLARRCRGARSSGPYQLNE